MKGMPKRALALSLALAILMALQVGWSGASAGQRNPWGGIWDQPLSAVNRFAHLSQGSLPPSSTTDTYIADDLINTVPWLVTSIFVPGDTWPSVCDLSCADTLLWAIYADEGGSPDLDPATGLPPPVWSLLLPPSDPQVTLSPGTSGLLTDVTLELNDPAFLPPGTWWLLFLPNLDNGACGCRYGRQPSDTTNGYPAQVANPGAGAGLPAAWTSVQSPSTWELPQRDFAFRLGWTAPTLLGDRVWYDTDQDGIQDTGEPGVGGIGVALYHNATCTGDPAQVGITDAGGAYLFPVPGPGAYCVAFSDIPTGWEISPPDQGADEALDSDPLPVLPQIQDIMLSGQDLGQDMGLYEEGDISGTVWCDENRNGAYDLGEGWPDVDVDLFPDEDCDSQVAGQPTEEETGADGTFLFADLVVGPVGDPACYIVRADVDDLGDCDSPYASPERYPRLDTDQPEVEDLGIGFYRGYKLGGAVWYDLDRDGIWGEAEAGLDGQRVDLYDNGECAGSTIASSATDGGDYAFDDLQPGTYCLHFTIPPHWEITAQDQGGDDEDDSDANPESGQVADIELAGDRPYESMGVYRYGSVGGAVFCDADGNARYDSGEGLEGVLVRQHDDVDCDGVTHGEPASALTGAGGFYQFAEQVVGPPGDPICLVIDLDPSTLGDCAAPLSPSPRRIAMDAVPAGYPDVDFGFLRDGVQARRGYVPLVGW